MPDKWTPMYSLSRRLLLETLVDAARFRGTCYRAANWIHVGQTARRGHMDREHIAHGRAVKDVYVILWRDAQQRLCGDAVSKYRTFFNRFALRNETHLNLYINSRRERRSGCDVIPLGLLGITDSTSTAGDHFPRAGRLSV
jgi:hypothetical protein